MAPLNLEGQMYWFLVGTPNVIILERLGVCKTRHFFYLIVYGLDASNTTPFKSILPLFGLFRCNYIYNCLCWFVFSGFTVGLFRCPFISWTVMKRRCSEWAVRAESEVTRKFQNRVDLCSVSNVGGPSFNPETILCHSNRVKILVCTYHHRIFVLIF